MPPWKHRQNPTNDLSLWRVFILLHICQNWADGERRLGLGRGGNVYPHHKHSPPVAGPVGWDCGNGWEAAAPFITPPDTHTRSADPVRPTPSSQPNSTRLSYTGELFLRIAVTNCFDCADFFFLPWQTHTAAYTHMRARAHQGGTATRPGPGGMPSMWGMQDPSLSHPLKSAPSIYVTLLPLAHIAAVLIDWLWWK